MLWTAFKRALKYWLIGCLIVACAVGYLFGVCMAAIHFGFLGIVPVFALSMLVVIIACCYENEKNKQGK